MIQGAEDRYVPAANAAALAGSIPGAKLRVLDHAGHLVFIERFAEVNREVVSFLKQQEKRGTRRSPDLAKEAPQAEQGLSGLARTIYRWIGSVLDQFR